MIEEKKNNGNIWFADNDLKIKLRNINEFEWLFLVSINDKNVCFAMLMRDFINWCANEVGISVTPDRSWSNRRGFKTTETNLEILTQEIKRFVEEYNVTPSEQAEDFLEEEWYSCI